MEYINCPVNPFPYISCASETVQRGSSGKLQCTLTSESADWFQSSWVDLDGGKSTHLLTDTGLYTSIIVSDEIDYTCRFYLSGSPDKTSSWVEKQLKLNTFDVTTDSTLNATMTGLDLQCTTDLELKGTSSIYWRTSNGTNITESVVTASSSETESVVANTVSTLTLQDDRYGNGSFYCVVTVSDREFLTELVLNATVQSFRLSVAQYNYLMLVL